MSSQVPTSDLRQMLRAMDGSALARGSAMLRECDKQAGSRRQACDKLVPRQATSRQNGHASYLTRLPNPLLHACFQFLVRPLTEFASVSCVCKHWFFAVRVCNRVKASHCAAKIVAPLAIDETATKARDYITDTLPDTLLHSCFQFLLEALTEFASASCVCKYWFFAVRVKASHHTLDFYGEPAAVSMRLERASVSLRGLQVLNLRMAEIQDLQPLSEMSCLRELDISNDDTHGFDPVVGYLRPLAGLQGLQILDLGFNEFIGSDSLRYLSGLTSLTFLDISHCIKNDDDLRHLRPMQSLSELILGRRNDGDMQNVLWLQGATIAGPGLQHLSSLPDLRVLHLSFSGVTDEGMDEGLTGWATRLEELTIQGCKHLSSTYKASLEDTLPNTSISL
jgi:hypothetical protein